MAATPPKPSASPNANTLQRKRDKKRPPALYLSFNWNDLLAVGPSEVVALAVRFDESLDDESILTQPLETGRLYDNRQEFLAALHYLREQTKPNSRRSRKPHTGTSQSDSRKAKPQALTPIILSGLLTTIEEQRDEGSESDLFSEDTTSELVQACEAMRQAALNRVRMRKKRLTIQGILFPIICISVISAMYLRTMAMQRHLLHQLDYIHSCDSMPAYAPACRIAEAWLWFKYRDSLFLLQLHLSGRNNANHLALLDQRFVESPFSMHTTLSQNAITKAELVDGYRRQTPIAQTKSTIEASLTDDSSFRWLGESTVNRLVREAIETYANRTIHPNRRILDVGCGVGASLYTLLPVMDDDNDQSPSRHRDSYQGVTASAAEIFFARRLLSSHSQLRDSYQIDFTQQSFDQQLPANNYTVAIAIESLSYSRNLQNTIDNIVKSLVTGGVLLIVDDVTYSDFVVPDVDATLRPSLLPHTAWVTALRQTNCTIVAARDLSVQYEILSDHDFTSLNQHSSPWAIRLPVTGLGTPWEGILAHQGNAASQRWIELQEGRNQLLELWRRRQNGYGEEASLSYNMYVCVKT
jgi:SAM-dependent methyltransferase